MRGLLMLLLLVSCTDSNKSVTSATLELPSNPSEVSTLTEVCVNNSIYYMGFSSRAGGGPLMVLKVRPTSGLPYLCGATQ